MNPKSIEEMEKLKISPAKWIDTGKQLCKGDVEASTQYDKNYQVDNVFHTTTKAELIKYLLH